MAVYLSVCCAEYGLSHSVSALRTTCSISVTVDVILGICAQRRQFPTSVLDSYLVTEAKASYFSSEVEVAAI